MKPFFSYSRLPVPLLDMEALLGDSRRLMSSAIVTWSKCSSKLLRRSGKVSICFWEQTEMDVPQCNVFFFFFSRPKTKAVAWFELPQVFYNCFYSFFSWPCFLFLLHESCSKWLLLLWRIFRTKGNNGGIDYTQRFCSVGKIFWSIYKKRFPEHCLVSWLVKQKQRTSVWKEVLYFLTSQFILALATARLTTCRYLKHIQTIRLNFQSNGLGRASHLDAVDARKRMESDINPKNTERQKDTHPHSHTHITKNVNYFIFRGTYCIFLFMLINACNFMFSSVTFFSCITIRAIYVAR